MALARFRQILCPVDGSDPSAEASFQAIDFARWSGAAITALYVSPLGLPAPDPLLPVAVPPREETENAMQEALIKTYRYVGHIREPRAFRPWLYRTVRNAYLMGRRKRVGEPTRLESLDEGFAGADGSPRPDVAYPGKNPEQLAGNAGLRRRLKKALRTLPGPYRAIVFLREIEGLSTREVAAVMGMSEDNVKTRLHRARVQLQAVLGADTV